MAWRCNDFPRINYPAAFAAAARFRGTRQQQAQLLTPAQMFSSGMHHADHAAWDLPFALFGSGSGTFRQNELVNLPGNVADMRQLRDFYFTLLNNYFSLGVSGFGDDQRGLPNAPITELLA
jgi:hypothetical protein